MDMHNGSLDAFEVKHTRFSTVQPRYVIAVSAFSKRINCTTEYQEYVPHVK